MPDEIVAGSEGPEDTRLIGKALGLLLAPGDYICLYGDLGAGKTTFVQGLCLGLGISDTYITSPTFSLVNEYRGELTLYHIDLYRLSAPGELEDIGFSEYPGRGVAAVEWPERAGDELPSERLDVRITVTGELSRTISVRASGERNRNILEGLCRSSRWSRR